MAVSYLCLSLFKVILIYSISILGLISIGWTPQLSE
jgi:hypothetical protein